MAGQAGDARITLHFTPTGCSWLNMEIFFGIITRQAIRRGTFRSVKELTAAIGAFIDAYNARCQPFTWTKGGEGRRADYLLWMTAAVPRFSGPGGWSPPSATFNLSTRQAIGRRGRVAGRIVDAGNAREAARRDSWAVAYGELRALDLAQMAPPDLEALADAAWWLSRPDESIAARQRAYAGYVAAGENPRAAFCAGRLCMEHFFRDEAAVASGWLMRAQRLLRDQPERVQHGYVALIESNMARARGAIEEAVVCAERATEIGQRFGDPDVVAMGIHQQGLALVDAGRVAEGMALLDEAMASVVAGELGAFFTGVVYCNVIAVCLEVSDVGRLGEWNDAARRWCESLPPDAPFPAICRVNRAEAASLRGAWPEAEAEALRAGRELGFNPRVAAMALYETGEIRRRIGNLEGAEEAFARANELGLPAQPGLALLRLAQGKPDAALQALRVAVADDRARWPQRARLLSALAEVALAASDLDTAGQACRELDEIASRLGTPALSGAAATAGGALRLAEGDVPGALGRLRAACAIWQELRLPYESARARMLYGVALRRAGSDEDALLELRAALATFERLGAAGDAGKAAALLGLREELPGGLTAREAEVLRLVAAGKTNRDVAAALVISEHTVARHLQNIFGKLGVSTRSAATAFAFEHGLA